MHWLTASLDTTLGTGYREKEEKIYQLDSYSSQLTMEVAEFCFIFKVESNRLQGKKEKKVSMMTPSKDFALEQQEICWCQ